MSLLVRQMLAGKPEIFSVEPHTTVFEALRTMADRNVGALLVLDDGELVGVFSERDYARKVTLVGKSSRELDVRDIMTSPVVAIDASETADDCMRLMTERRIRHLPVLDRGRLVGVVSIGDVVRAVLEERDRTIRDLHGYIVSGA